MKNPRTRKTRARRSDLRVEFTFDYSVSRPNRFAAPADSGEAAVKVDPDVPEGD